MNLFKNRGVIALSMIICILAIAITPTVVIAGENSYNDEVEKAIEWLIQNQFDKGYWRDEITTPVVVSSKIASYLKTNSLKADSLFKAEEWFRSFEIKNNDYSARILPFITEAGKYSDVRSFVVESQNNDGGWGIYKGYQSSVLDTVLVINSLLEESEPDIEILQRGLDYLIKTQNDIGGWSYVWGVESSVALTSQIVLCMSKFIFRTNLTSDTLEETLIKAGKFIISSQKDDKTWGTSKEKLPETLLAYRAVLNTLGIEPVEGVEFLIKSLQQVNGSWYDSPYITILAVQALDEKMNLPYAKINDINIFKYVESKIVESYDFTAYEDMKIYVECEYDQFEAAKVIFVTNPYGDIVYSQAGSDFKWNTAGNSPGKYSVIAIIKDKASGKILTNYEKAFEIDTFFNMGNMSITTYPKSTYVDQPVTVNAEIAFYTKSNVDRDLQVISTILDENGNVVTLSDEMVKSKAENRITAAKALSFEPDVSSPSKYIIKSEIIDSSVKIAERTTSFKVLPPPPPTRVDAVQSVDKEVLYPGTDSVTLTYNLFGEGTPEMPEREPIDLVLLLDSSGSMSGTPWTQTKEASKIIANMILPQDRCAVIDFGSRATLRQGLTSNKELLNQVIDGMPFEGGGTRMDLGISRAIELIEEEKTERETVFMLLSDGIPNNRNTTQAQANIAAEKGMKIYTLGLGSRIDEDFLKNIASLTGATYKHSPGPDELAEMMIEIAGDIFDTAGKDIVIKAYIPKDSNYINIDRIVPAPSRETIKEDGSMIIEWKFPRIVMGQERLVRITFDGENLISDTNVVLTEKAEVSYIDGNGMTMNFELPGISVEVNKYNLKTIINTDKDKYSSIEDVHISVESKNLTGHLTELIGKVKIVDENDKLVKSLEDKRNMQWQPEETTTQTFNWNAQNVIAGIYKVKVIWMEQNKIISSYVKDFRVIPDDQITNSVVTDKKQYNSGDTVQITDSLHNPSTNANLKDISVITTISNSKEEIIWGNESIVKEILSKDMIRVKNSWNTELNLPGIYKVTSVVHGENELSRDVAKFEILDSDLTGYGIDGVVEVKKEKILRNEDILLKTTAINTGNKDINVAKRIIKIVNPLTEEVVGTIEGTLNLKVDETREYEVVWKNDGIRPGTYLVSYKVELSNGMIIPLDSSYFKVLEESSGTRHSHGTTGTIERPEVEKPGALPEEIIVSVSADKSIYLKGETITYTIRYKNILDITAEEFNIIAEIPQYTSLKYDSGGEVKEGVITWKIPELSGNSEGQIIYAVKVEEFEEPEILVSNTAEVKREQDLIGTSTIRVMLRSLNGKVFHKAYVSGYPDGTFRPEIEVTRAEIAAMFASFVEIDTKVDFENLYTDLSSDHWGLDSIIAVTKAGLFKGYKDGTFKPDANITRAELSAVIANYLEIENIRPVEINYHDIEGHWAYGIIQELHRHNIIKGYEDGSFRPDNNIKRSEAVVLINKMLYRGPLKTDKKIFMDVDKNHWAFGHIAEAAIDHELILDDDGNEILKEGE
ncbi:UNVERIFIED_CONTAM: Mg-chelatase subunit ChlD [Acetivibrio alkalicellulosi]